MLFIYFIIVVYYIVTVVKLCYVCVHITLGLRNCSLSVVIVVCCQVEVSATN